MIQQANDRFMFVNGIKTTGDSHNLASFVAGLFFERRQGEKGKLAVDINGSLNFPSKEEFVLRVGSPFSKSYPGNNKKDFETYPFTADRVEEIRVSSPSTNTPTVDEVIIGYDGANAQTAPIMYPGEVRNVSIRLSGKLVSLAGYNSGYVERDFSVIAPECPNGADTCTDCDPCEPVNMYPLFVRLRDDIANSNLGGGIKISDLVDVGLIRNCTVNPGVSEVDVTEFTITVPDGGSLADLQTVQATTNGEVSRRSYDGVNSVYVVRQYPNSPLTNSPLVISTGSILANCDTCPTGYTASNIGGYLYSVMVKPSVLTTADAVTAFPGTKNGNADKYENTKLDVAQVDIITEEPITDAQLDTFMDTAGVLDVFKSGQVSTVCTSTATQTYNWVAGTTNCKMNQYTFYIDLKKLDCATGDGERLGELQQAYPYNTVAFVQAQGECMEQYSIVVYSNEICTDCGNTVTDVYKASKPNPYRGSEWYCDASAVEPSGCSMGIRLTGKFMSLIPDDCMEDVLPTYYTSTEIAASAGEPVINTLVNPARSLEPWSVKRIQASNEVSHFGFKILPYIRKDYEYFIGEEAGRSYFKRFFSGESKAINPLDQYVDFTIKIGWPRRRENSFYLLDYSNFHLIVKHGEHQQVENLVNAIAKLAGLPAVSADASL